MDVRAYLRRIGYNGTVAPTTATLRELHRAHLLAVPFENLDIHLGRPITLDQDALFDKVVTRRRGGFCYELNGLFAALLRAIGFQVTLLSAGVARAEGGFGPEFDHLTLLVTTDPSTLRLRPSTSSGGTSGEPRLRAGDQPPTTERQATRDGTQSAIYNLQSAIWLADVGFGDSFREPLRFVEGQEQQQDGRAYRLDRDGEYLTLMQRDGAGWEPQYRFTLQPYEHAEYAGMCHYHQTSPASSFTRKRVCTIATPDGRVTLSDRLLITTTRGERTERALLDEQAYRAALREYFGIEV
ncbi:MAG TPA: arylamine N-acetyltransferase [Roseiflexaceae bacterium]|nr:arylamine N-acetyltransferase [Roseiflexaceae bacterium]